MKILIKSILILCLLVFTGYFVVNYALERYTPALVKNVKNRLAEKGIEVRKFEYEKIALSSYNTVALKKVDLAFQLNRKIYGKESFNAQFRAGAVAVRLANLSNPSLFIRLEDFSILIAPDDKSVKKVFAELKNAQLRTKTPLYLHTPFESAKSIMTDITNLFKDDFTSIDIEFEAKAMLGVDDKKLEAGLYTERENDTTYLRFDKNDIGRISEALDLELVDAEIAVVSRHPSKVPAMIKITSEARRLSKLEKSRNPSFPEDAFRHLYWSYHLTRELGPELAREITDAHETAPGNTKDERLMDYHNNEVARRLAAQKLSDAQLKQIVLHSSKVIRNPGEVPQKTGQ